MSRSEKIIWVCFAATSMQLVFQQPYIVLVWGERTNLFSGLLCFLTLLMVIIFKKEAIRVKSPEFMISAALSGLAVLSALFSSVPFSASCRVFALLASGLGGFWCARLLLHNPVNQQRFQWLGLFLLAGMLVVSMASYLLFGGIDVLIKVHTHSLTDMIMLLSFAPLAFLASPQRRLKSAAVVLLSLSYVVLCMSQRVSAIFIPIGLCVAGVFFGRVRLKHLLLVLIPIALSFGVFYSQLSPELSKKVNIAYPNYRIEWVPFSWHIASQHPWLGLGVRAPRNDFLQDYQVKYPYIGQQQFATALDFIVTADNIFLTFMTDLGFPFFIIYVIALGALFYRLIRLTFRPPPGLSWPPLALLFPLAMALTHFMIFDGLLYVQDCWFFHILLGLIPGSGALPAPAAGDR